MAYPSRGTSWPPLVAFTTRSFPFVNHHCPAMTAAGSSSAPPRRLMADLWPLFGGGSRRSRSSAAPCCCRARPRGSAAGSLRSSCGWGWREGRRSVTLGPVLASRGGPSRGRASAGASAAYALQGQAGGSPSRQALQAPASRACQAGAGRPACLEARVVRGPQLRQTVCQLRQLALPVHLIKGTQQRGDACARAKQRVPVGGGAGRGGAVRQGMQAAGRGGGQAKAGPSIACQVVNT